MKNSSPSIIALYAAIMSAIAASFLFLVFHPYLRNIWLEVVIIFVTITAIGYFIFNYTLNQFIYRKIKLIYKSIHSLKIDRFTKDILGKSIHSNDPISDVEEEVKEWAEKNQQEI